MKKTLTLYKKIGQTPLELLNIFRKENSEYADVKIAYAGRLDPMAHGLMLYLVGEECKKRDSYQDIGKTYEFDLIVGFSTDTQDAMGLVTGTKMLNRADDLDTKVKALVSKLPGKLTQEYPAYSSKTINGIPMHKLAREGKLADCNIPTKIVEIYSAKLLKSSAISTSDLFQEFLKKISRVKGNFRQEEILNVWKSELANDYTLPVYKIRLSVSSGTYVRSIADNLGKKLGSFAIAFDIYRTKVGEFDAPDVILRK